MKKLLFFKPDSFYGAFKSMIPPMGPMYLSSYIRKHLKDDIRIDILDNRLCMYEERELRAYIQKSDPMIIGISSITMEAENMHRFAKIAKEVNSKVLIVAGGPHPSHFYEDVLADENIDVVVKGEGEITFLELLEKFFSGTPFDGIDGIVYRREKQVIKNPEREFISNLDSLPYPAWDLIDINAYSRYKSIALLPRGRYMPVYTSRGCPYGCIYCHNIFGKKFRSRSPENVIEEFDILINKYGIHYFEMIDDIFNLDYQRAEKINDLIISKGYKIKMTFGGGLRSDLLDENMLYKMKKAGVIYIVFAIESASGRIQRMINKNFDLTKAMRAVDIASRMGIFTCGTFMLGFPQETREEMLSTVELALKSRLNMAFFCIVTPFKGTALFNMAKDTLVKKHNNIPFRDYAFFTGFFNLSAISDRELLKMQQMAFLKFYLSIGRVGRILRKYITLENGLYWLLVDFYKFLTLIANRVIYQFKGRRQHG